MSSQFAAPGFAARLVVAISPEDVGARVSLRRRLQTGEYSDVVGDLEAWSGGTLKVRRRTGEVVEVAEATLVAGKKVPPPPARRSRSLPGDAPTA
ncbi:hypothetical protein GCM10022221_07610 [Actinocorallia aurea]